MNNGIALMVTEWGTVNADGNGAVAANETNTWMNFLKGNGISHANWALQPNVEGSAALNPGSSYYGNWSDGDLTPSGLLVRDILRNW